MEKCIDVINRFLDYASALDFLHEKEVVNNDVSPANMLVVEDSSIGVKVRRGLLIDMSVSRNKGKKYIVLLEIFSSLIAMLIKK